MTKFRVIDGGLSKAKPPKNHWEGVIVGAIVGGVAGALVAPLIAAASPYALGLPAAFGLWWLAGQR